MELKLIQLSLSRTLISSSQQNIKTVPIHKHVHLHAQWRCKMQEIASNGQHSTKKNLVHVVKEGETLTSISKLYGVTIPAIAAANKDIVNAELVFGGQVLSIPSVIPLPKQMPRDEPAKSSEYSLSRRGSSFGLYDRCLNQKIFTIQSFQPLSYAKTTGYFLVLVPLIAFCIRCITVALHSRVTAKGSEDHRRPGTERMRWKSVLQEFRDPDAMDTDLAPGYDQSTEEQYEVQHEDDSRNYSKLERDYEKFLSECGISKWGYWRGGSPQ